MPLVSLTGKQRHHLRALGHPLNPLVQVGKEGITGALLKAVDQALTDHELIKVKIGQNAPEERHAAAVELAKGTRSEVAQVLGNLVLLYRPNPDEPAIVLPRAKGEPRAKREAKAAPKRSATAKPARSARGASGKRTANGPTKRRKT